MAKDTTIANTPSQEALNAVKSGYVSSVEEYDSAVAEGRAGAQYGYESMQTPSLSSDRAIRAIKKADKTLATLDSKSSIDQGSGRPNMSQKITPTDTTADYVELYNPTNERTLKISNVGSNLNQIKGLLEQGFEVSESNTSVNIPYQSGQTTPTQIDFENLLNTEKKKLETFKISNADLADQIDEISSDYDSRIQTMKDINTRRESSFQTLGYRLGGRFTGGVRGGVFGGVISEEERQGQKRISDLDAAKKAEIAAAKTAAKEQNWKVYLEAVKNTERIYNDQVKAVSDYNKEVKKQNDKLQETLRETTVQSAIVDLYKQGVTDPLDIYDFMNFDESGKQIGDVPLTDITGLLEDINKGQLGGFTQTQKMKLEQAGLAGATRQEQLNYLFAPKPKSSKSTELTFEKFLKSNVAKETLAKSKDLPQEELDMIMRDTYEQVKDNPYFDISSGGSTKTTKFSAASIPEEINNDLMDDISAGSTLPDLYKAYPDVSSTYIKSIYNDLTEL